MIRENDVVSAARDLNDKVPLGSKGTVLMVYPDFPNVFEVEFFDELYETLDVLTVEGKDLSEL